MTSRYQKLYGSEHWRRRAKAQMRQEPLCRMCLANSKVTPAQVADHIEKHGGNFNKFRLGALQSLCAACHNSTKNIIEKRGYDPAIGADGWPLDPRHPVYQRGKATSFAKFTTRSGPTVRPASLPPAGQAGRTQFGSDRGRRQRWKLETLEGRSTPGADQGI